MGKRYDWNAHPLAPPGTRAVINEDAVTRASWGPRGIDAWYCGPAMDYYRCCYFYVPEHRSMRISDSFDLFPQHCIMPTFTPEQHVREEKSELIEAMQKISTKTRTKLVKELTKKVTTIQTENKQADK